MTAGVAGAEGFPDVAVVIPCRDEAPSIADVVASFAAALPGARIVVVDNDSSDDTATRAGTAGAQVVFEPRRGKGFALQAGLLAVRDAALVVMVDGDGTYPASRAPQLIAAARGGADMVLGTRLERAADGSLPSGHGFGNHLFVGLVRILFGLRTTDLFTGYRVLSRRFLDRIPLLAREFEVEAELSIQAAAGGFRVAEVPVEYRPRRGSASKLRTFRDGSLILLAIVSFFRDGRPLACFGTLGLVFFAMSLSAGWLVLDQYLATGLVLRIPLAVLAAACFIIGALSFTCGLILSSINRRAAELAQLLARR